MCFRARVQDIDFTAKNLNVRDRNGAFVDSGDIPPIAHVHTSRCCLRNVSLNRLLTDTTRWCTVDKALFVRSSMLCDADNAALQITRLCGMQGAMAELTPLVVTATCRLSGIASRLVRTVVEHAKKNGARFLSARPAARNQDVDGKPAWSFTASHCDPEGRSSPVQPTSLPSRLTGKLSFQETSWTKTI